MNLCMEADSSQASGQKHWIQTFRIEAERGIAVLNFKEVSETEAHLALAQEISHL